MNFDLSTAKSNMQKLDEVARILRLKCGLPDDWMPDGIRLDQVSECRKSSVCESCKRWHVDDTAPSAGID